MTSLFSALPLAEMPVPEQTRVLLDRAVGFPALAGKYRDVLHGDGPLEFASLPTLGAEELRQAVWTHVRQGGAARRSVRLYLAGGTRERPEVSLIPHDLFAESIIGGWQPLGRGDVLVNLSQGERLWPAHDLCTALASMAGATVLPFGDLGSEDIGKWLGFFQQCGANAVAADTTTIESILRYCLHTGQSPQHIRTLIWLGARRDVDSSTADLVARILPETQVWGLYGSPATWAVAVSGPNCSRGVLHPLPYQYIELLDDQVLTTTVHDRAFIPILRYRTGDTGAFTACRCGNSTPALRVTGHSDDGFTFRGARFTHADIVGLAEQVEGVQRADLAVMDHGRPTERLRLRVHLEQGSLSDQYLDDWIRTCVIQGHMTLGQVISDAVESFEVVSVPVGSEVQPALI